MDYLAVDSGTTNSRLWLMRDLQILARRDVPIGVRNSAIDGNNHTLMEAICHSVSVLRKLKAPDVVPEFVIAAGMITSNLGLYEVKHVQAPAGMIELATRIEKRVLPKTGDLPFYFIPGVRSGPASADLGNANDIDIVRGEETEVVGALKVFGLCGPLLYIHLGSHTKLMKVDPYNRISGGASTLGGELLRAVQQETILRDSLFTPQSCSIETHFLEQGWNLCRKHGLFRTLYLIRILGVNSNYSKESLTSLFLGALINEEFRCLESTPSVQSENRVILSGLPQLQPAWTHFMKQRSWSVKGLSTEETEQAFLRGLYEIFNSYSAVTC